MENGLMAKKKARSAPQKECANCHKLSPTRSQKCIHCDHDKFLTKNKPGSSKRSHTKKMISHRPSIRTVVKAAQLLDLAGSLDEAIAILKETDAARNE